MLTPEESESLKPGDTVLYTASYGRRYHRTTVTRKTATGQFVVSGFPHSKFSPEGRMKGGAGYSVPQLYAPTPERRAEAQHGEDLDRVSRQNFTQFSGPELRRVVQLLDTLRDEKLATTNQPAT